MSVVIEGGRVPKLLQRNNGSQRTSASGASSAQAIRIALINNMPDAALEDTEVQFFELLDAAATNVPISLKLYSLPELPRGEAGRQHLAKFYFEIQDLLNSHFDGAIITGTEPRQPELRDEPYWPALTEVLDWAEQNTSSTVLSCLAAHAGVLHSDGIGRHRLRDKQFGVFDYATIRDHALTNGVGKQMQIPHSRWNEVCANELTSCGYEVLTQSATAGVDLFVKRKQSCLLVHFQGHPEYGARTLLKEYRRDIKRFLRRERETYPSMPHGYFDDASSKLLAEFRALAVSAPSETLTSDFPEATVAKVVRATWQASAATVYRNWLQYLSSRKADVAAVSALTPAVRV